jgi:HSP20 family protein
MNKNDALTKGQETNGAISPVFVEAEKMFDRIAEITKETAQKAYEFFQNRGAALGTHLDDWFKAESEILRPTPVEVTETKDEVNIRAAVPGFKPDEIEVSVKDNLLILSGETKSEQKREDENTFYSEWRSNRFFRQLALPSEVETENVEAFLEDGVLRMSLKKKEAEEAAKIAVKAA